MMRLIRTISPSALGLQGMRRSAPIPGCEGLWGIRCQESTKPTWRMLQSSEYGQKPHVVTARLLQPVSAVEPGGVMVHRPLLPFSKASLVATCEANGIPYVQDKTNSDPTLTPRNAVRILRGQHKLPRALQDEAILELVTKARKHSRDVRSRGAQFLREVQITRLSLVSGFTELVIPEAFVKLSRHDPSVAAHVVEKLCSLVSPSSTESNRLLTPSHLVDQLAEAITQCSNPYSEDKGLRLTIGKVLWETTSPALAMKVPFIWRLSRCAPAARGTKDMEVDFPIDPDSGAGMFRSRTLLWDFRYWIRLQSSHEGVISAVRIRFLQPTDLTSLHNGLPRADMKHVIKMLSRYAPAHIRYTLPVLTIRGTIIAFPTLRADTINKEAYDQQVSSLSCQNGTLRWQVHYKAITESATESAIAQDIQS